MTPERSAVLRECGHLRDSLLQHSRMTKAAGNPTIDGFIGDRDRLNVALRQVQRL